MILYLLDGIVQWLHEDITIKEQFKDDDNCIVIDGKLEIPIEPNDNNIRVLKYNAEQNELYYEIVGVKEVDHEEITKEVYQTTSLSADDNLINMDLLVAIDDKLNLILDHLGLNV